MRTMGDDSVQRRVQGRISAPATWVVDGWTPGTRFSWTVRAIGVRTTGTHVVEPVGADQCLVTLEIVHRGALAALVGRMTAAMTERYLRLELAGLTARAEARAGGEPPEV
jgi:hypothetical protein